MKTKLVFISFGAMILSLGIAYYCSSSFWQTVGINVGTSFMSLGVAIIFVNIYMEQRARQGAVKSLLSITDTSIRDFHNLLLDLCWARFGRDDWAKIGKEYVGSNGQPAALRQDVRNFLYEIATTNEELQRKTDDLQESLTELSRMVGWSLDVQLLEACLDSRISIIRLKSVTANGTDESKSLATEHLMDAELHSQRVRRLLMKIAGIDE